MSTPHPAPAAAPGGPPTTAAAIDQAIHMVERLYQTVTGRPPPPDSGAHAPIPPEADPGDHVQRQLERLLGELDVGARSPAWGPRLAVWELDDAIVIAMDLPGVARDAG